MPSPMSSLEWTVPSLSTVTSRSLESSFWIRARSALALTPQTISRTVEPRWIALGRSLAVLGRRMICDPSWVSKTALVLELLTRLTPQSAKNRRALSMSVTP